MIFFSDLDGSFLATDKSIGAVNRAALDEIERLGMQFVPCSGRALGGIDPWLLSHPAVRYAIAANGATVTELESSETVYRADLGHERARRLFELARGRDVTFDIFADGKCFEHRSTLVRLGDFVPDAAFLKGMLATRTPFDGDTLEFMDTLEHIERIAFYWHDPADRDFLDRESRRLADVSVVRSYETNVEVSDGCATKGSALSWLCDHLGIPAADAVAFGDNVNDVSMLEAAGTGVAMGNAAPEAKDAADAVCATNDEEGVGRFILELLDRTR